MINWLERAEQAAHDNAEKLENEVYSLTVEREEISKRLEALGRIVVRMED